MGELKNKASHYTEAFGGAGPLADVENRRAKARKIRAVLLHEGVYTKQPLRILDIGCSFGIILQTLTPHDGLGVGVDIDRNMRMSSENVVFSRADAENLPFASGTFDVVICNHVYEHTDSAEAMLAEIERVLSDSGVCYFAGPNKYDLVEPHYGLPFLSWLPRRLADWYVRITGRGDGYAERPYSNKELGQLLRNFDARDYTAEIVNDPERFEASDILPPGSIKRRLAVFVLKYMPFIFPGHVIVLRKRTC